jgi:hypothetical protein
MVLASASGIVESGAVSITSGSVQEGRSGKVDIRSGDSSMGDAGDVSIVAGNSFGEMGEAGDVLVAAGHTYDTFDSVGGSITVTSGKYLSTVGLNRGISSSGSVEIITPDGISTGVSGPIRVKNWFFIVTDKRRSHCSCYWF